MNFPKLSKQQFCEYPLKNIWSDLGRDLWRMQILDSSPVTSIKWLQYRPSPGRFPTNLEHSQETYFLECFFFFFFFVKQEILNCRPVTLENRNRFAKDFCENVETLEQLFFSEHFQKSMWSWVFNPIVDCRMKS